MSPEDRLYFSTVAAQGGRDLEVVIERLYGIGLRNIELSAPHPRMDTDDLVSLLNSWRDRGCKFLLHNYFPRPEEDFVLNIASPNAATLNSCKSLINEACAVAQAIKAPVYGIHAGYLADAVHQPDGSFKFFDKMVDPAEKCLDRAKAFVASILESDQGLPERGILLENLFPSSAEKSYSLACTPEELAELFESLPDDRVGFLFDLSHFFITCTLGELDPDQQLDRLMELLGERMWAIHLSGNDGVKDSHDPIDPDSWIFSAFKRIAKNTEAGRQAYITYESRRVDDDQLKMQRDLILEAMS